MSALCKPIRWARSVAPPALAHRHGAQTEQAGQHGDLDRDVDDGSRAVVAGDDVDEGRGPRPQGGAGGRVVPRSDRGRRFGGDVPGERDHPRAQDLGGVGGDAGPGGHDDLVGAGARSRRAPVPGALDRGRGGTRGSSSCGAGDAVEHGRVHPLVGIGDGDALSRSRCEVASGVEQDGRGAALRPGRRRWISTAPWSRWPPTAGAMHGVPRSVAVSSSPEWVPHRYGSSTHLSSLDPRPRAHASVRRGADVEVDELVPAQPGDRPLRRCGQRVTHVDADAADGFGRRGDRRDELNVEVRAARRGVHVHALAPSAARPAPQLDQRDDVGVRDHVARRGRRRRSMTAAAHGVSVITASASATSRARSR